MADVRAVDEIVAKFLLDTCQVRRRLNMHDICSWYGLVRTAQHVFDDVETHFIPMITGSVAELYIQPMLSCVGDADIMFHRSNQLAIPAGTAPPAQLPGEFHSRVAVCEMVDSGFPGYVYLMPSYLLTECVYDGKYNAVHCPSKWLTYQVDDKEVHGPACVIQAPCVFPPLLGRLVEGNISDDLVWCMRCLSWPPQAADWPSRHREYGWPDSATVDLVVNNGCDVVAVAHRLCRQDKWMNIHQCRLSFSRAEIVLLNSWMPAQQIVYHMLRVFVKTERLTDRASETDAARLSNYHIKTLLLSACEPKPRSWWSDANVVRISVTLLHTLGVWLTDARCRQYFIHNCNLFDHPNNCYCEIAERLMSETKQTLAEWFINNYIQKCAQLPSSFLSEICDRFGILLSQMSDLVGNVMRKRLMTVLSVADWILYTDSLRFGYFAAAELQIMMIVFHHSLTVRTCLCLMKNLAKIDQRLSLYFAAITFLHVARKTAWNSLTDELLDVLATTCLQSNDVRRWLNARHSSVLSLSQAAMLMKVVANNSRSTVQLIEIGLELFA